MIQATDLFPKVVDLWGNPSIQELSPQSLRNAYERVFDLTSLKLAANSTSLEAAISNPFSISDDGTYSANMPVLATSAYLSVEYRSTSGEEWQWCPLPIGVLENWGYYKENAEPTAVFINSATSAAKIKTNFSPVDYEFRVFYIRDNEEGGNGDVSLPSFFSPMFQYGMASEVAIVPDEMNARLKQAIKDKLQMFHVKYMLYVDELVLWARTSRSKSGVSFRTPSNARRKMWR